MMESFREVYNFFCDMAGATVAADQGSHARSWRTNWCATYLYLHARLPSGALRKRSQRFRCLAIFWVALQVDSLMRKDIRRPCHSVQTQDSHCLARFSRIIPFRMMSWKKSGQMSLSMMNLNTIPLNMIDLHMTEWILRKSAFHSFGVVSQA